MPNTAITQTLSRNVISIKPTKFHDVFILFLEAYEAR